jgi:hypothetical protein
VIGHSDLTCDPAHVVQREDNDRDDEPWHLGNRRDVTRQGERCRLDEVVVKMMLRETERVEADLVAKFGRFDQFRKEIIDVMAGVRPVSRKIEAYLHGYSSYPEVGLSNVCQPCRTP